MNAARHNSKLNTQKFYLIALMLVLTGLHSTQVIVAAEATRPVAITVIPTTVQTPATVIDHIIHIDTKTPLAREDVDAVRVAVVPGKAYIPATTPQSQEVIPGQFRQPLRPGHQRPIAPQPGSTDFRLGTPRQPSDLHKKISARATDTKMQTFVRSTSMQQLSTLFQETSQMIDARHVSPPAYEVRTRTAIEHLIQALENENFQRANGVSPSVQSVRQVQSELQRMLTAQPARTVNEAVGLMQWSAELVSRQLGIRREAVALEFLNSTIDSLDQYSAFMPEATAYAPGADVEIRRTAGLEENIVGIGVELEAHPMGAELVGIIENSPAAQLGLQERDVIVAVNRQSVRGLTLNDVASRLGGPIGQAIELDIERDGRRYRGTVTRQRIYVSSVTGVKMIEPSQKVAYIRLKQFSESSRKDLETAMLSLHNQGMQALILDLRGNPGGLLDQAIEVSNLFLPCGTIVSTQGRTSSDNTRESATYQKTWNVPLVVLVDDNSASASEIFAAAIQENGRGIVVGRQSYGKGTVQTHFPLRTVSGTLKLTTAKFYSPSGREMAGAGVTPDVTVNMQTAGYRTADDADIATAMQTIEQGYPKQLAQRAAQCQPPNAQVNPLPRTPDWQTQLQSIFRGN